MELKECSFDIPWHGDVDGAIGVVPVQGEAKELGSQNINGDLVLGTEGSNEVLEVRRVSVLDPEVINDKGKDDTVGVVFPKGRGVAYGEVAKLGEVCNKVLVGNASGLLEARHTLADLKIDPAISGLDIKVVLLDNLERDEGEGELHVFGPGHGHTIVKVLDVQGAEAGPWGGDGGVEEALGGDKGGTGG